MIQFHRNNIFSSVFLELEIHTEADEILFSFYWTISSINATKTYFTPRPHSIDEDISNKYVQTVQSVPIASPQQQNLFAEICLELFLTSKMSKLT